MGWEGEEDEGEEDEEEEGYEEEEEEEEEKEDEEEEKEEDEVEVDEEVGIHKQPDGEDLRLNRKWDLRVKCLNNVGKKDPVIVTQLTFLSAVPDYPCSLIRKDGRSFSKNSAWKRRRAGLTALEST